MTHTHTKSQIFSSNTYRFIYSWKCTSEPVGDLRMLYDLFARFPPNLQMAFLYKSWGRPRLYTISDVRNTEKWRGVWQNQRILTDQEILKTSDEVYQGNSQQCDHKESWHTLRSFSQIYKSPSLAHVYGCLFPHYTGNTALYLNIWVAISMGQLNSLLLPLSYTYKIQTHSVLIHLAILSCLKYLHLLHYHNMNVT